MVRVACRSRLRFLVPRLCQAPVSHPSHSRRLALVAGDLASQPFTDLPAQLVLAVALSHTLAELPQLPLSLTFVL